MYGNRCLIDDFKMIGDQPASKPITNLFCDKQKCELSQQNKKGYPKTKWTQPFDFEIKVVKDADLSGTGGKLGFPYWETACLPEAAFPDCMTPLSLRIGCAAYSS